MSGDDDDDSMLHAADEPTAMWGADALAGLDLERAPSEPPKPPAQPGAGGGSSIQVSLDQARSPRSQPKRPAPRSQAGQWAMLIGGAIVLAAIAFFVVRALR